MGLQVVSVVTLARLLTPSDFGVVALALVVIGFGELFRDFGLSQASVQATILSKDQRSNLFWLNTAIGVVLALLCWIAAWPVAAVTGQTAVSGVCQALAVTFLLNAMAAQFRAGLLRQLRFITVSIIEIGSAALGLAGAIAVAVAGGAYWALVVQQVATTGFTLLGLVVFSRWLPGLPNRRGRVRSFLVFGGNLVASQLVGYVASNVDTVLVGLRYGTTTLGLYNRAFQLVVVPVGQVRAPMTNIAVPVLSKIKDDVVAFDRFVERAQLLLGYALCIALGVAAATAEPIVALALGPAWSEAAAFFRWFAIAAIFQTLAFVGFWVYLSRALTPVLFRYTMVSAVIKIACVLIGSLCGPLGVAVGFAVAPALSWPLSLWWLARHTTVPLRGLYLGATRIVAAAAVAGSAAFGASQVFDVSPLVALVAGLVAALLGAALLLIFPVYRADVTSIRGTVRLLGRSTGPQVAPD